ncbi:MAG: biosynthetic-type acetolactate synthase large subunit [Lachnospiraceae bacterium]|jgi:acetolactate synthase-1/2/3 large subunit|nr:biosynthetic-type acetolactate synthase large subunit [Lachnospiraceae bacterium]
MSENNTSERNSPEISQEPVVLNGSEILIECLKEQGVKTVFGYPGGAILNIYDALYKHQGEITHVLTSHEQGAAHAADGYARATGKVGVCFATSGPGATNLVTGIATAYMDSIPVVAITCNVGVNLLGKDSFQEIDILGVTMPITKYNFIVKDIRKLASVVRRAFVIAQSGRPGPVLIDITKNVTADTCAYTPMEAEPIERQTDTILEEDMEAALELIRNARKPFIFVGGGAVLANASEELRTLAHRIQAPVADSLMGKGAFDGTDEMYTGMVGMHGTKTSNFGITECDLLIVAGARFSDRVTGNASKFAQNAKILQIDVDPAEINKNIRTDVHIIGDLKVVLRRLNARLDPVNHDEWVNHVERMKDMYPLRYDKSVLTGPYIMEMIYDVTKGEAMIVTEVGQHQMWAAQYYKYKKPRTFLTSGGLGTMGYGLGASLGAKLGCRDMGQPDKVVVNIAGDGCFRMNMNEIATAVRYNIPIIQVVVNNHVLGMVRQWQTLFYGKRYSHTVLNDAVDFVKLAEAMGAKAYRVSSREEFRPVFEEALSLNAPVVIDCQINCDDKVYPMVSPGAPIQDAFDDTDLKIK